jgi:hypothetical protein
MKKAYHSMSDFLISSKYGSHYLFKLFVLNLWTKCNVQEGFFIQNFVEQSPNEINFKLTKNWQTRKGIEYVCIGIHRHDTTKYYKTDPT